MSAGEIATDIVLVGAGHAHVHVLAAFGQRPERGVRVTLLARDLQMLYSGMLPGVIAGLYRPEDAQIDVARLAAATGARLVHAQAAGLDRAKKRVLTADGAAISYDVLSIDVGITPALSAIAGAAEHAVPVKPIGAFLQKLATLRARCREPHGPRRIAVIGGGAGGVELLLSLRTRLLADARADGLDPQTFHFALVTDTLLENHNARVGAAFCRMFRERAIVLYEHRRVTALSPGRIETTGGPISADVALIATGAAAPPWLAATGLALDRGGFLAVAPTLQCLNDPNVFAAGDCAALVETPREKAGVYAVRAGPPLARNLRACARNEPPVPWRPQRRHLALISTGERCAVASRGPIKLEGAWVWRLKDFIDRRWMRGYQQL